MISEQSTGYPGYDSIIARDKATIGRILLDNGYATAWFGKDHNTPAFAASQAGPFDQWPTGLGFEYFYGFVGGDANQWGPNLFRNTTQIYPFEGKEPGTWNLITAMADDAIDHLHRLNQIDPGKKFFIKYAPGATHAPFHPTEEWVKKIHDMHLFDDGYENNVLHAVPHLRRLGVPAVIFAATGALNSREILWTNRVELWWHQRKRSKAGPPGGDPAAPARTRHHAPPPVRDPRPLRRHPDEVDTAGCRSA